MGVLPVPAKHSQTRQMNFSLLQFRTVSAKKGPCPGQVFSYSTSTKNPPPGLAISVYFMGFPGSIHPPFDGNFLCMSCSYTIFAKQMLFHLSPDRGLS